MATLPVPPLPPGLPPALLKVGTEIPIPDPAIKQEKKGKTRAEASGSRSELDFGGAEWSTAALEAHLVSSTTEDLKWPQLRRFANFHKEWQWY